MRIQTLAPIPTIHEDGGIDKNRRASWLWSAYKAPRWKVSNTHDSERTASIDFDCILPDGRSLLDAPRLIATVKEYAWWLRDPRFSRIDDAATHALMVRNMIYLAHAVSLRGLHSFAHLQPYDVETLVEDCRFGVVALTRASERLRAGALRLREEADQQSHWEGLPEYIYSVSGVRQGRIHTSALLQLCNLPSGLRVTGEVSAVIGEIANAAGLRSSTGKMIDVVEVRQERKPLTVQTLQRWLDPLEQLYAMRRRIQADAISFRPFPQGAARIAAVKGIATEPTPVPPPKLILHLLEGSVRIIADAVEPQGVAAVERAATACWIVIAAFSARRDGEINELESDCLLGDDESGWWVRFYIEKTLQRSDSLPVPAIVARAVETLQRISAAARATTGSALIFQWKAPDGSIVSLDCGRRLDRFAAEVGVPGHGDGPDRSVPWHWHPHQFRRFFAVLYFYRFEGATIEALSHHLRHFNLEMTRHYITKDPEVAAMWTDVRWNYEGRVALSVASGTAVAGSAGDRLRKVAQRIRDALARKLHVVDPNHLGSALALVMRRQGMVLTPKPWVTCTCPTTRDAARTAACRRRARADDPSGPDFAHAGPTVCGDCPHALVLDRHQTTLSNERNHLADAENGHRAGTLFGALESARIIELDRIEETRYGRLSAISFDAAS